METGKIAEERMEILFQKAEQKFKQEPILSQRYIELAQKIGERTETPIPSELRKKFCSTCKTFLKPGKNCTVRLNSEERILEYVCGECEEVERHGY